jgi:hypothetical protein
VTVPEHRRRRGGTSSSKRGKASYATMEDAGEPHRGRITEAEKELVWGNLEHINNARLRRLGCGKSTPPSATAMVPNLGSGSGALSRIQDATEDE